MEYCSIEHGLKLLTEHYNIGSWYKFPGTNNRIKYMKITSINKIGCDRFELIGTGFSIDKGKLINFKKGKEIVLSAWAKHYNTINIECSPESVKENYIETLKIFKEDFLSKF